MAELTPNPAVDALTDRAMIVLQDRPVVAFSAWLADVLRVGGETGRRLQVVTPPATRVTVPLRLILSGPNATWVVRDGGGYYDGLSGVPLHWDGAMFGPVPDATTHAPGYTTPPDQPVGAQLTLTFRVRGTRLGVAAEEVCRALTGEPPAGWGTAEPVIRVWRTEDLADFFAERGSRPTWLTVVGAGLVGTLLVSATPDGLDESVTLVLGYLDPGQVPIARLPDVAGGLGAGLVSFFAQLAPGRADLTTAPRWLGPPGPVGMGVTGAASSPPGLLGRPIGPVTWYDLGDGRDQDGWQRYQQLNRHLHAQLQ